MEKAVLIVLVMAVILKSNTIAASDSIDNWKKQIQKIETDMTDNLTYKSLQEADTLNQLFANFSSSKNRNELLKKINEIFVSWKKPRFSSRRFCFLRLWSTYDSVFDKLCNLKDSFDTLSKYLESLPENVNTLPTDIQKTVDTLAKIDFVKQIENLGMDDAAVKKFADFKNLQKLQNVKIDSDQEPRYQNTKIKRPKYHKKPSIESHKNIRALIPELQPVRLENNELIDKNLKKLAGALQQLL